jgi:RNA polymerase sigma-70 factor, ECF subfamily
VPDSGDTDESAFVNPDSALITRVQRGDMDAFDALIAPLLPRALRLARRLMRNVQDAEDLVQEAALRSIERIDLCDPRRPFAPWFIRLMVNLGMNQLDAGRVRRGDALPEDVVARDASPSDLVEAAETRSRFASAVDALSNRQRQIVMLHEVEGWSAAQISEALGMAAQTVRWHLHEARKVLRRALAPLRDDATGSTPEAP